MTATPKSNTESQNSRRTIAIVGGGLTGMSAAFRLHELATEKGKTVEITIFESSPRLGGIVGTEQIGDYLVDVGADSFLTTKPGAIGLCRRLGIEDRLVRTEPRYRGALVLRDGRPIPVPEGFQLLSPTAVWPVITSPLFSVWGKLRLLSEWFIPRRVKANLDPSAQSDSSLPDESVAEFTRRRFGREALDRLIQPLVGGIYTSDPERLSLAATMPRFLEMERDHGSLIRASLAKKAIRPIQNSDSGGSLTNGEKDSSSGARYGQFAGLKGGMEDLATALRQHCESTCSIRLKTSVVAIRSENNHLSTGSPLGVASDSHYQVTIADGTVEHFDSIIVTTSGSQTANILRSLDSKLSVELGEIEFASSALVVTGHRLADIRDPLNAFGLVIPHAERRRILAVSFSSRKFPDRAPKDRVLLRTFVGGALQPDLFEKSDEEMKSIVQEELADILGVRGTPDFVRVYRYRNAMPQYYVGHLERVARIEALTRQHPGLALAGIAYRGVGIPDTISSGEQAAESLMS